mmetsp:Transcript_40422/g.52045  ORF Transcript_40422/g.52045 Transcript_40422/m.52045 type:complete len:553 (+) Transcript_40422:195-1853(+)
MMISCTLYAAVSRTCHGMKSWLDSFIHNTYLVHTCIWGISAVSIIVPFFTDSIGPAGYTCWIIEHPRPFGIIWRFTFFYGIGFIVILISIYQSFKVRGWVKLLVLTKMHEVMQQKGEILPRDKGASWSTLQEMRKRAGSAGARVFLQHSSIIRLHHQLKWYPVVLTISWGYRCSCRLNEAMSHYVNEERYLDTENSTAGLLFIFAGGFATQATLNFFIYGFTPAVRKAWLTLWHEVVVEGNMRSIARFESYAVSPPIEEDDGYDPRYEDSESDVYPYNGGWGSQNQFNAASHGQQSASASASSSSSSSTKPTLTPGSGGGISKPKPVIVSSRTMSLESTGEEPPPPRLEGWLEVQMEISNTLSPMFTPTHTNTTPLNTTPEVIKKTKKPLYKRKPKFLKKFKNKNKSDSPTKQNENNDDEDNEDLNISSTNTSSSHNNNNEIYEKRYVVMDIDSRCLIYDMNKFSKYDINKHKETRKDLRFVGNIEIVSSLNGASASGGAEDIGDIESGLKNKSIYLVVDDWKFKAKSNEEALKWVDALEDWRDWLLLHAPF